MPRKPPRTEILIHRSNTVFGEELMEARLAAGLTQADAAALIGYTERAWQDWEGERRGMRRVLFELFLEKLKTRELWKEVARRRPRRRGRGIRSARR